MYEGWHLEEWHPEFDEKREQFTFGYLRRREFKKYLSADFWSAFKLWKRYSRYGLPAGKGSNDEPESIIELLDLFDDTRDKLERLAMESKKPCR